MPISSLLLVEGVYHENYDESWVEWMVSKCVLGWRSFMLMTGLNFNDVVSPQDPGYDNNLIVRCFDGNDEQRTLNFVWDVI